MTLLDKSIKELSKFIKTKKLSPVTLVEESLANIGKTEKKLNSFITVTAEYALKRAKEAEAEIQNGSYRGILHGIPYSAKDLFATKGILTTDGSELHCDYVPDYDATSVRLLNDAGAILVGKTNLNEFAYGGTNDNDYFGDAFNPWNTDRIPGGSSGGSAASVAARTSCFSLGTDTGGSVRVPASMCGTIGIKPTYGRISRYGVTVLSPSMDHVGVLSKTVEDSAIVLSVIAGKDSLDLSSASFSVPRYEESLRKLDIKNVVIGVCPNVYENVTDDEVKAAYLEAVKFYKTLGARIVEIEVPDGGHEFNKPDLRQAIIAVEAYAFHEKDLEASPEKYGRRTRDRILLGQFIPGYTYVNAQRWRTDFINKWMKINENIDMFIMPTSPVPAFVARTDLVNFGDTTIKLQKNIKIGVFTTICDQNGFPAISVPCGFTSNRLPIGFQLQGRPFEEELILQVAEIYEAAHDYKTLRPPVCG